MKVLLLTQIVPNPPDAGPKIKTHFTLRTLAEQHDVELVTYVRSDAEVAAAQELLTWCRNVYCVPLSRKKTFEPYYAVNGWTRRQPYLVARDARREIGRTISSRLASGSIDVLHADQLSMAQYLHLGKKSKVRKVFDAHNAVWDLVRDLSNRQPTLAHQAAAEVEWRMLRRFEGEICRTSDLTLTVSEFDRDLLQCAAKSVKFRSAVIPIGVEVEGVQASSIADNQTDVLSVSTLHYPPNAEAMRWYRDTIWPSVRAAHGDVESHIVGGRPPKDLEKWGEHDPRVTVHGYLPSLDDMFNRAAVFVVPLRSGSGVRVKVLEAMARGVPVVSTSIGVQGLDLKHDQHLLIADTPQDFANAILQLMGSVDKRRQLANAARAQVLKHYDWRRCCQPLLAAYQTIA